MQIQDAPAHRCRYPATRLKLLRAASRRRNILRRVWPEIMASPSLNTLQVGSYLVPNNLSANAHGNGYADPNIYIAEVLESVQVDGGAFNVREGNHSVNLAATYGLRSQLRAFYHRDRRLPGHCRSTPESALRRIHGSRWRVLLAMAFSTGWSIGKQYKINGERIFHLGDTSAYVIRHRILRLLLRAGTDADLWI